VILLHICYCVCFMIRNLDYHQAELADITETSNFIFTKMQTKEELKVTVFWDGALCSLVQVSGFLRFQRLF
jgi:hypothetical protein